MQKYRVTCPHCEACLLVTEDLLGQPGTCPGCHADFMLPSEESFTDIPAAMHATQEMQSQSPADDSPPPASPPFPPIGNSPHAAHETSVHHRRQKPVRIEGRPALRIISTLLKALAILQVLFGCLMLIVLVFMATTNPLPPLTVLSTVGIALLVGAGAIPTLAFSELILVFISQEEMLRHLVNHFRSQQG